MNSDDTINEELVRHHLQEMGYDQDALPKEAMKSFVQELREMYKRGDFEQEFQTTSQEEIKTTGSHKIIKRNYAKEQVDDLIDTIRDISIDQSELTQTDYSQKDYSILEGDFDYSSGRSSPVDYSDFKRKPKIIRTQPPPRIKKCDPVDRYHQLQSQWSKDKFLRRLDTNKMNFLRVGRFGGMAGASVEAPRRSGNLNTRENVVPTDKDRKKIIWDIRNKLAVVDTKYT